MAGHMVPIGEYYMEIKELAFRAFGAGHIELLRAINNDNEATTRWITGKRYFITLKCLEEDVVAIRKQIKSHGLWGHVHRWEVYTDKNGQERRRRVTKKSGRANLVQWVLRNSLLWPDAIEEEAMDVYIMSQHVDDDTEIRMISEVLDIVNQAKRHVKWLYEIREINKHNLNHPIWDKELEFANEIKQKIQEMDIDAMYERYRNLLWMNKHKYWATL